MPGVSAEITESAEAIERQEALSRAYAALNRRDRTVAEVRDQLRRARVTPELIETTVAELIGQGYLDDERYARCFAEDRRNLDGWGAGRIVRRLVELGIEPELAERAAGPREGEQELAAALSLLDRRMRTPPTDNRTRRRALGMLLRRGYGQEVAYEAVRRFEEA
jgi:regulatory protein